MSSYLSLDDFFQSSLFDSYQDLSISPPWLFEHPLALHIFISLISSKHRSKETVPSTLYTMETIVTIHIYISNQLDGYRYSGMLFQWPIPPYKEPTVQYHLPLEFCIYEYLSNTCWVIYFSKWISKTTFLTNALDDNGWKKK